MVILNDRLFACLSNSVTRCLREVVWRIMKCLMGVSVRRAFVKRDARLRRGLSGETMKAPRGRCLMSGFMMM